MQSVKSVCVYCGSSNRAPEVYKKGATELGLEFVKNDVRLIYGGGQVGLMGIIANSVMQQGGRVTGFIPQHLHEFEKGHTGISELFIVDSMHERKRLMFEQSDGFVILPGGFGTLDEVCEIITWRQLRLHAKPIVFVDINNYWSPLFDHFVSHMIDETFVRKEHKDYYRIVKNIEDVLPTLEELYNGGGPNMVSRYF